MKKIIRNSRIIAMAFITIFSVAAKASEPVNTNPVTPVELKYAGMVKNNPVFELSIAGKNGEDVYTISITDVYGNILYTEKIKAEAFTKRFLLNIEELGEEKLYFKVAGKKISKTAVYEIGNTTRSVSETTISQLQ